MSKTIYALLVLLFPGFALAANVVTAIGDATDIFKQLLPILLSLMIVVFSWGIVKFIYHADDEKAVAEGKGIMVWGVVGIGVVTILWGLVAYVQMALGLNVTGTVGNGPQIVTNIP